MAVYFYGCITLDGYLASKEHGLDWLYDTGSPEETSCGEFYSHMDVTLMGRRTFQEVEKAEAPLEVYPTQILRSCPSFFTNSAGSPLTAVKPGQESSLWVNT